MKSFLFSVGFFVFCSPLFALTNGQNSISGKYREVVKIETTGPTGTIGTGVFIDRETILTAEHCVPTNSLSSVLIDGKPVALKIIRPKQTMSSIRMDLALIKVKPSASSQYFYPLAKSVPKTRSRVLLVGHGPKFTKDPQGVEDEDYSKKFGHNFIAEINMSYINIKYKYAAFNPKEPSGALPGDSGGPMLYNEEVVGIASKSGFGTSNYINLFNPEVRKFIELNL